MDLSRLKQLAGMKLIKEAARFSPKELGFWKEFTQGNAPIVISDGDRVEAGPFNANDMPKILDLYAELVTAKRMGDANPYKIFNTGTKKSLAVVNGEITGIV